NPAHLDLRSKPGKVLGVFPRRDPLRSYLERNEKAQAHMQRILGALHDGSTQLDKDNAVIAAEQKVLRAQMESLRRYAYMAERLDTALAARIATIEAQAPDRARALRDDVLVSVRQRRQDILIQLAVAVQGYAALRVVTITNRELARAVRTAATTTFAALRTAVMVAQALATVASLQRAWDGVSAVLD